MRIYLAGPLFTTGERLFNSLLADALVVLGHEVWLPQDKEARPATAANIFAKDVEGLNWANVVVACMDGPDPDSGTCWECGYAYAKGKPVVVFRTDFRSAGDVDYAPFNLMLSESAREFLLLPMAGVIDVGHMIDRTLMELEDH